MLILQPSKRITIEQMKLHRWMTIEVLEISKVNSNISCDSLAFEPNEQVIRIMQNLGIDSQRTRESLKVKEILKMIRTTERNSKGYFLHRTTATIITRLSIYFFLKDFGARIENL